MRGFLHGMTAVAMMLAGTFSAAAEKTDISITRNLFDIPSVFAEPADGHRHRPYCREPGFPNDRASNPAEMGHEGMMPRAESSLMIVEYKVLK